MSDARVERYAELLLDTCLGVERGWQVMVWSTPLARPLLEEVMKQLAERGAYPLLRLTFSGRPLARTPSMAAACTARRDLRAGNDRGTDAAPV